MWQRRRSCPSSSHSPGRYSRRTRRTLPGGRTAASPRSISASADAAGDASDVTSRKLPRSRPGGALVRDLAPEDSPQVLEMDGRGRSRGGRVASGDRLEDGPVVRPEANPLVATQRVREPQRVAYGLQRMCDQLK